MPSCGLSSRPNVSDLALYQWSYKYKLETLQGLHTPWNKKTLKKNFITDDYIVTNILDIMFNEEADRKKRLEKQETLREVFFYWLGLV